MLEHPVRPAVPCRLSILSSFRRRSPSFKKVIDAAQNLLRMIGLLQRTLLAEIPCLLGRPDCSGGEDHIDARVFFANPSGKTEPVHAAAQLNFGENNVNLLLGSEDLLLGSEDGHHIVGRDTLENLVSAIAQIVGNYHADENVRFHNKNCTRRAFAKAMVI